MMALPVCFKRPAHPAPVHLEHVTHSLPVRFQVRA
jgi:hypothetical protein